MCTESIRNIDGQHNLKYSRSSDAGVDRDRSGPEFVDKNRGRPEVYYATGDVT